MADGAAPHAFRASGHSNRERIFRRALRHSRHVRVLRVAVPATLVVGLAVWLLVMWLQPLTALAGLPKELTKMVISGTKITMQQPRLAGYTQDGRPYELNAQAAAQDITKPDVLELRQLRAKMEMQDQGLVELTAATGLYDTKSELLTLRQDVVITSSNGYQGFLSEALVDIRAGRVVSEKPVHVKMLEGTLDGNRMEVTQGGDVVRFDGGVVMHLKAVNPSPANPGTTNPGAAKPGSTNSGPAGKARPTARVGAAR